MKANKPNQDQIVRAKEWLVDAYTQGNDETILKIIKAGYPIDEPFLVESSCGTTVLMGAVIKNSPKLFD
jgi:hypothetical protein